MIDFLCECGLSKDLLKQIEEANSSANLYNLNCNEYDVVQIINYLTEIGVRNVDDLLIYRIDLFFTSFDLFKEKISKYDKDKIVDLINKDYSVIDKIINKENF